MNNQHETCYLLVCPTWEKIKPSTLQKCWDTLFDGIFIRDKAEAENNLEELLENIYVTPHHTGR